MTWLIGFMIAFGIAGVAYNKKSLTVSGAGATVIVGTLVYASGGVLMMAVLVTFFVSSVVLGRLSKKQKHHPARTATQVFANGFFATLMAVLYSLTANESFLILFGVSVAVATADTWSSELGVFSTKPPINLVTLKRTATGVSGSVSGVGLLATVAGAVLISTFFEFNGFIILFGVLGSLIDSILGTFQVRYQNPAGEIHEDMDYDPADRYVSGVKWLTNTAVNFCSQLLTVSLAVGVLFLL